MKKFYNESLNKNYPNYRNYKSELIKNFIYNKCNSKLLVKFKLMDLENKIVIYNNDTDSDSESECNFEPESNNDNEISILN